MLLLLLCLAGWAPARATAVIDPALVFDYLDADSNGLLSHSELSDAVRAFDATQAASFVNAFASLRCSRMRRLAIHDFNSCDFPPRRRRPQARDTELYFPNAPAWPLLASRRAQDVRSRWKRQSERSRVDYICQAAGLGRQRPTP